MIETRFGKVKRNTLPFTYLGIEHVRFGPQHLFLHQEPYLLKLKPMEILPHRRKADKSSPLDQTEHHAFRSLLCSILWLCLTRVDLVADVVQLQQEMVHPLLQHALEVNAVLAKALRDRKVNGLHFSNLTMPLKIVGIGDAGQASKRSLYAQEGKLVLLMSDSQEVAEHEWLSASQAKALEGVGHPLFHSGKKATRVSHSTSHAEALSAIGTTQMAQLVSNRMTEPFAKMVLQKNIVTTRDLILIQANNWTLIPVDHVTDCMDLFELACGVKGLSADKNQRLVIASIREDRANKSIRRFMHFPTSVMLADGLTKGGMFPQLLRYLTTGRVAIELKDEKRIRQKTWRDLKDTVSVQGNLPVP